MLTHAKTDPLKVALLSISPHNRAILEFFFAAAGRNLFKAVTLDDAKALIVDYDHVGAREEWEQHAPSGKPGIILSVHPVELTNAIWIAKPLTSRALTDAAERVQQLLATNTQSTAATPLLHQADTPKENTDSPAASPLDTQFPQPFGVAKRTVYKPRTVVLNLDDDEDDEPPVVVQPPTATPEPEVVFDPAEHNISMEEVARPVTDDISPEIAEHRWRELCGDREDINDMTDWHLEAILFTPENYLLTNVQEAVRLARQSNQQVELKLPGGDYALLMPETHQVYCTLNTSSDTFATLCNNPVQPGQVALHILSSTERLAHEAQIHDNSSRLLDMEAFLWVISLLTAQGRLSRHVDIKQRIALKYWPNLTRIEQFPQVTRIAALWNQRPSTPLEIAKALNIPQRYVFSFYTAANTLNLFELDQTKLKSREKEKPKESRGLFSRLLKRLLGGGAK
jgi:hypothetical protein